MRLALLAEAEAELDDAAAHYDEGRPGLGDELLLEVAAALETILEVPETWPRWPGAPARIPVMRRFLLARFPHAIGYEVHGDLVVVVAVAHPKRKPLYWIGRTP